MFDLLFDVEFVVDAAFECKDRPFVGLADADDRSDLAQMIVRIDRVLFELAADELSICLLQYGDKALAIRRLVRSYPMLDRGRLMGEASRCLAQHALEGRSAAEVIDELEVLFVRHYEAQKGVTSDRG